MKKETEELLQEYQQQVQSDDEHSYSEITHHDYSNCSGCGC